MKKCLTALVLCFLAVPVLAETTIEPEIKVFLQGNASPIETLAKQATVIEAETGTVLYAKQQDAMMPTSSMSKVLTMYLVFEAIKDGKLKMDDTVQISNQAWSQKGSRMFVKVGEAVKVEDLVRGVIVQSGNDAALALAEAVAGTEANFATLMNEKARTLGMTRSHFTNASGLPDPAHYSTAQDLALLALALLRDFPEHYHYYSEKEFTYNNIKQGNRNPLLYRNIGVDGIKTGHTDDAGYGLIASALRDGRRIITVVNGLTSMQERADEPANLIEWAYREYGLFKFLSADASAGEAKIWLGRQPKVAVAPARDVVQSLPRNLKDKVEVTITVTPETEAPIQKGQPLGMATIHTPGMDDIEVPLVAAEEVKRVSLLRGLWEKFKRMIGKA